MHLNTHTHTHTHTHIMTDITTYICLNTVPSASCLQITVMLVSQSWNTWTLDGTLTVWLENRFIMPVSECVCVCVCVCVCEIFSSSSSMTVPSPPLFFFFFSGYQIMKHVSQRPVSKISDFQGWQSTDTGIYTYIKYTGVVFLIFFFFFFFKYMGWNK